MATGLPDCQAAFGVTVDDGDEVEGRSFAQVTGASSSNAITTSCDGVILTFLPDSSSHKSVKDGRIGVLGSERS